jgi:hypothetical protein
VVLLLFYFLNRDTRFGFALKNSRLPLFYPFVIGIALLNWIIYAGYLNLNYSIGLALGLALWFACLFSSHLVKLFVEKNTQQVLHNTIVAFFVLNALVSFFQYAAIIIETGVVNAYRYQGDHQKYFISTGDFIKGISFDTSTTNAILNCFGVIYFLFRKNIALVFLCMITLLMTASNVSNILLVLLLIGIFIFNSNRDQKSVIVGCIVMLVIFMGKVSPQNNDYLVGALEKFTGRDDKKISVVAGRPDTFRIAGAEEERRALAKHYIDSIAKLAHDQKANITVEKKIRPVETLSVKPTLPKANIHSEGYQFKDDTNTARKELLDLTKTDGHQYPGKRPGKLIALDQTLNFFSVHPARIITGYGTGKFSSKLAFKTTGLQFAGGYPKRFVFVDPEFRENHLELFSYFFSQHAQRHSVMNSPNSVYDQLLSEYGLLGLAVFFIFYLGFFVKKFKALTYGRYLLIVMMGFFFLDYWFEQLSVVAIFEMLFFLNLKQQHGGETGN